MTINELPWLILAIIWIVFGVVVAIASLWSLIEIIKGALWARKPENQK